MSAQTTLRPCAEDQESRLSCGGCDPPQPDEAAEEGEIGSDRAAQSGDGSAQIGDGGAQSGGAQSGDGGAQSGDGGAQSGDGVQPGDGDKTPTSEPGQPLTSVAAVPNFGMMPPNLIGYPPIMGYGYGYPTPVPPAANPPQHILLGQIFEAIENIGRELQAVKGAVDREARNRANEVERALCEDQGLPESACHAFKLGSLGVFDFCDFCDQMKNAVYEESKGEWTRVFCRSCMIRYSKLFWCQAEGCDDHPFVNQLGDVAPLCTAHARGPDDEAARKAKADVNNRRRRRRR